MTTAKATATPKPEIIKYAIAGDETGGSLFLFGKPDSTNIVILSAGYPDDHGALLPMAARLADEEDCLAGVTCLPGYDDLPGKPWTSHRKVGYSFGEMVSALKQAVKTLKNQSTAETAGKKPKLIGIFHDWGCLTGSLYANQELSETKSDLVPDKLVFFDVLGPPHRDMKDAPTVSKSLLSLVIESTYRVLLATAFVFRLYISEWLAVLPFTVVFFLDVVGLAPGGKLDKQTMEQREPPMETQRMIYMAYPYWNLFKIPFGIDRHVLADFSLPPDLDNTPVLYMYGKEKNFHFHDEASLQVLTGEEKCGGKSKVVAVDKAAHWLYLHQPEICFKAVREFIHGE